MDSFLKKNSSRKNSNSTLNSILGGSISYLRDSSTDRYDPKNFEMQFTLKHKETVLFDGPVKNFQTVELLVQLSKDELNLGELLFSNFNASSKSYLNMLSFFGIFIKYV